MEASIYICAPEVLMLFSDNFDYQVDWVVKGVEGVLPGVWGSMQCRQGCAAPQQCVQAGI